MTAIARRLRRWREHRRLTQRQAAREAGISQSAWCLYETGQRVPYDSITIQALLRVTRHDARFALTLAMFVSDGVRRRSKRVRLKKGDERHSVTNG